MTRVAMICFVAAFLTACGADGAPEPFESDDPAPARGIGLTETIEIEEVL